MPARLLFASLAKIPPIAAVALVLVAALLLAGCVSPGPDNQAHALPAGKYVLLTHDTEFRVLSQSGGACYNVTGIALNLDAQLNEKNGTLTVYSPPFRRDLINESPVLIYVSGGQRIPEEGDNRTGTWYYSMGQDVYSLPSSPTGNVTLDSVSGDGTIAFRYDTVPIVLKQSERWENSTRRVENEDWRDFIAKLKKPEDYGTMENSDWQCRKEILVIEKFHNAGIFDTKDIIVIDRE